MQIEKVELVASAATVKLTTEDNRIFWLEIKENGLSFYSERSSSGTLESNPVVKSADDIFAWIKFDKPVGGHKTFGKREGLRQRLSPKAAKNIKSQ